MKIIEKILASTHFRSQPPVLIDIGASGEINQKWKSIAKYCVCLAFDADTREFSVKEDSGTPFKKLIKINRIVTADAVGQSQFYLTKSPFCSSLLEPESAALEPWIFRDLFKLDQVVSLPSVTISDALAEVGLNYVDWFKSDTQGTDLRLFKSLPESIKSEVLAVEVEPGIIDAYKGEDKLHDVMREMAESKFWLSGMTVKGVQRIKGSYATRFGNYTTERSIKASPGWAEVTYLKCPDLRSERSFLLLFVFALIEKQYGFAVEIIDEAMINFPTPLLRECREAVLTQLERNRLRVPLVVLKRQIIKIFSKIHD